VVRAGGETYEDYFSEAKISVPLIIKFVLEHGDTNVAQDGNLSAADNANGDAIQHCRVIFGSCGQDHSEERFDGHCAPASTYGFNVFEKEKDEEKREKIKTMVGSLFDNMQKCKDYIETVKLGNSLPLYHKGRDKRFAEKIRVLLNCCFTHWEDFMIQLKNITQGEWTWKHKDQWNCTWNGYTKTLTRGSADSSSLSTWLTMRSLSVLFLKSS
jgi:hypothetical protein